MNDPQNRASPSHPAHLIAVAPDKYACGLAHFVDGIGLDKHGHAITVAPYVVTALLQALERKYDSDAHAVAYVIRDTNGEFVHPLRRQPRLNKSCLGDILAAGFNVRASVWFADVDRAGHAKWDSPVQAVDVAGAVRDRLPELGIYATSGGLRLVLPLDRELDVGPEYERRIRAWFDQLAADLRGIDLKVGLECCDWSRNFRLPSVSRESANRNRPVAR